MAEAQHGWTPHLPRIGLAQACPGLHLSIPSLSDTSSTFRYLYLHALLMIMKEVGNCK